mmetsp:Transcript_53206/g.61090  ORF Transcript_53206/g.61090 Transcript_53206/m.61090 type:complete len:165 (+) Transcript_53206:145-639(+)
MMEKNGKSKKAVKAMPSVQKKEKIGSPSPSGSVKTSMDDIFKQLKKPRAQVVPQEETKRPCEDTTKSDGLFRDTSKTVEMEDDAFFGEALMEKLHVTGDSTGPSLTKKGSKARKITSTSASASRRKELRGFDRVVTEDEIAKMTSTNPNAGTTPNCPFDCDCCF